MKNSRTRLLAILVLMIILGDTVGYIGHAEAKDTITWLTFDFPPLWIAKGEQKGTGISDMAVKYLQEKLTEYNHKSEQVNLKRLFYTMQNEKNVCTIGIIKTSEREEFLHYSIPALIRPGLSIVIKKGRADKFGYPRTIILDEMLKNQNLTLGIDGKRSYTGSVDVVLKKYAGKRNITAREGYDLTTSFLKMLSKGHIDYLIEYPSQVLYISKEIGLSGQFVTIDMAEAPDFTVSNVVAPKNEWGKNLITRINTILREGKSTSQYRGIIERWIEPGRIEEFRNAYSAFSMD